MAGAVRNEDLPPLIERYLEVDAGRAVAHERGVHEHGAIAAQTSSVAQARNSDAGAQALIALEHADIWLAGRRVLHDVTWRLMPGEHWLVTGANGSGKSSFLRLLYGALRPALGGSVSWPALGNPRAPPGRFTGSEPGAASVCAALIASPASFDLFSSM